MFHLSIRHQCTADCCTADLPLRTKTRQTELGLKPTAPGWNDAASAANVRGSVGVKMWRRRRSRSVWRAATWDWTGRRAGQRLLASVNLWILCQPAVHSLLRIKQLPECSHQQSASLSEAGRSEGLIPAGLWTLSAVDTLCVYLQIRRLFRRSSILLIFKETLCYADGLLLKICLFILISSADLETSRGVTATAFYVQYFKSDRLQKDSLCVN